MRRTMALMISRISVIFTVIMVSVGLAINPLSVTASAGAVAAPVTGELVGELLVALGLATGDDTNGFDWRTDTSLGQNIYTTDIFGNVVPKIKTGEKLTDTDLSPLLGTVIPDDVYNYDGTTFTTVGGKTVTTSDLFLMAKSLVGVSYYMPTNISGMQASPGIKTIGATSYSGLSGVFNWSLDGVGNNVYYIPFVATDTAYFVNPVYLYIESLTSWRCTSFTGTVYSQNLATLNYSNTPYISYGLDDSNSKARNFRIVIPSTWSSRGNLQYKTQFVRVSGTGDYSPSAVIAASCLTTVGVPVFGVYASTPDLGGSIVQVKQTDEDDNNEGSTPPAPQPPEKWQIWKTITDLADFLEDGTITNGGSDFGQFVNNNYNYVDVNINVPDETTNNVNISGGLDINGNGNVDITIHEDISLPSGGDGSGFYNPNAVDAIAALVTNNPVVSLIEGVFKSIDPALVGIFSVSVSLLLVLGIWKLIRG